MYLGPVSPVYQCSITMMEFASNTRTCPNFSATQLKILPLLQGHHVHLLPAKDLPLLVLFDNSKPFLKQPDRHTHSASASSSPPSLLQNSIKVTSQQRDKLLSQSGEVYIGLGRLGIFLFDSICGPLGHGNWPWFFTSQVSTISVFFGIRWNRPNSHFAYFTHTSPNMGSPEKGRKKVSQNMHLLISCTMGRFPASKYHKIPIRTVTFIL